MSALRHWHEVSRATALARRSASFFVLSRQAAALRTWRDVVERRAAHRRACSTVLSRWRSNRAVWGLTRWREAAAERRAGRESMRVVVARMRQAKVVWALRQWRENAAGAAAKRAALSRCVARWRLAQAVSALRHWHEIAQRRNDNRRRLQAALALMGSVQASGKTALLGRIFGRWREAVEDSQREAQTLDRAVRRWRAVNVGRAIATWAAWAATRAHNRHAIARAAAAFRSAGLRKGLNSWKEVASLRRRRRRAATVVASRWRQGLAWRGLSQWREWAAARRTEREQRQLAAEHNWQRLVSGPFTAWARTASDCSLARQQEEAADSHFETRACHLLLRRWAARSKGQARIRAASAQLARRLADSRLRSSVRAWRDHATDRAHSRALGRMSRTHMSRWKASRGLEHWRAMASRQAAVRVEMRSLEQTADAYRLSDARQRLVRRWARRAAVRASQRLRTAQARAVLRAARGRRCLTLWRRVAGKLARARTLLARAATIGARAKRQGALLRWRSAAHACSAADLTAVRWGALRHQLTPSQASAVGGLFQAFCHATPVACAAIADEQVAVSAMLTRLRALRGQDALGAAGSQPGGMREDDARSDGGAREALAASVRSASLGDGAQARRAQAGAAARMARTASISADRSRPATSVASGTLPAPHTATAAALRAPPPVFSPWEGPRWAARGLRSPPHPGRMQPRPGPLLAPVAWRHTSVEAGAHAHGSVVAGSGASSPLWSPAASMACHAGEPPEGNTDPRAWVFFALSGNPCSVESPVYDFEAAAAAAAEEDAAQRAAAGADGDEVFALEDPDVRAVLSMTDAGLSGIDVASGAGMAAAAAAMRASAARRAMDVGAELAGGTADLDASDRAAARAVRHSEGLAFQATAAAGGARSKGDGLGGRYTLGASGLRSIDAAAQGGLPASARAAVGLASGAESGLLSSRLAVHGTTGAEPGLDFSDAEAALAVAEVAASLDGPAVGGAVPVLAEPQLQAMLTACGLSRVLPVGAARALLVRVAADDKAARAARGRALLVLDAYATPRAFHGTSQRTPLRLPGGASGRSSPRGRRPDMLRSDSMAASAALERSLGADALPERDDPGKHTVVADEGVTNCLTMRGFTELLGGLAMRLFGRQAADAVAAQRMQAAAGGERSSARRSRAAGRGTARYAWTAESSAGLPLAGSVFASPQAARRPAKPTDFEASPSRTEGQRSGRLGASASGARLPWAPGPGTEAAEVAAHDSGGGSEGAASSIRGDSESGFPAHVGAVPHAVGAGGVAARHDDGRAQYPAAASDAGSSFWGAAPFGESRPAPRVFSVAVGMLLRSFVLPLAIRTGAGVETAARLEGGGAVPEQLELAMRRAVAPGFDTRSDDAAAGTTEHDANVATWARGLDALGGAPSTDELEAVALLRACRPGLLAVFRYFRESGSWSSAALGRSGSGRGGASADFVASRGLRNSGASASMGATRASAASHARRARASIGHLDLALMRRAFTRFDADGDGFLLGPEVDAFIEDVRKASPSLDPRWAARVRRLAADGLSFDEFCSCMLALVHRRAPGASEFANTIGRTLGRGPAGSAGLRIPSAGPGALRASAGNTVAGMMARGAWQANPALRGAAKSLPSLLHAQPSARASAGGPGWGDADHAALAGDASLDAVVAAAAAASLQIAGDAAFDGSDLDQRGAGGKPADTRAAMRAMERARLLARRHALDRAKQRLLLLSAAATRPIAGRVAAAKRASAASRSSSGWPVSPAPGERPGSPAAVALDDEDGGGALGKERRAVAEVAARRAARAANEAEALLRAYDHGLGQLGAPLGSGAGCEAGEGAGDESPLPAPATAAPSLDDVRAAQLRASSLRAQAEEAVASARSLDDGVSEEGFRSLLRQFGVAASDLPRSDVTDVFEAALAAQDAFFSRAGEILSVHQALHGDQPASPSVGGGAVPRDTLGFRFFVGALAAAGMQALSRLPLRDSSRPCTQRTAMILVGMDVSGATERLGLRAGQQLFPAATAVLDSVVERLKREGHSDEVQRGSGTAFIAVTDGVARAASLRAAQTRQAHPSAFAEQHRGRKPPRTFTQAGIPSAAPLPAVAPSAPHRRRPAAGGMAAPADTRLGPQGPPPLPEPAPASVPGAAAAERPAAPAAAVSRHLGGPQLAAQLGGVPQQNDSPASAAAPAGSARPRNRNLAARARKARLSRRGGHSSFGAGSGPTTDSGQDLLRRAASARQAMGLGTRLAHQP